MSVQNGERLATKQDLADFYNDIRPYMGGIVTSKAGFTPIGTIISVMGTTAPTNYLACDGTVYNIADYTELANYFNTQFGSKNFFGGDGTTTFAVPDLRGEFLRGTGTNSHTDQGSGANVGNHQDATETPVIYDGKSSNNAIFGWRYPTSLSAGTYNPYKNQDATITVDDTSYGSVNADSTATTATQGVRFSSRPTNTSILWCIATKNFYIDPTLDYSTDEKVVGTWIDGRPVYQKTVEITNIPNNNMTQTPHNISNLDIVIKFEGMIHVLSTAAAFTWTPLPRIQDNSTTVNVGVDILKTAIQLKARSFDATKTFDLAYVTLQYTKTTDT